MQPDNNTKHMMMREIAENIKRRIRDVDTHEVEIDYNEARAYDSDGEPLWLISSIHMPEMNVLHKKPPLDMFTKGGMMEPHRVIAPTVRLRAGGGASTWYFDQEVKYTLYVNERIYDYVQLIFNKPLSD